MSRKEERIKKLAYAAHSEKTVHTWNDQLKKIKQKKTESVTNSTSPRQKRKLVHLFQIYLLSIWAAHIYA